MKKRGGLLLEKLPRIRLKGILIPIANGVRWFEGRA